jgi:flagellar assembly factor FliW
MTLEMTLEEGRPGAHRAPEATAASGRRVEFVEPIPGFPDERDFLLAGVDPQGVLFTLRSRRTPSLRFVVMPPAPFFPDYQPEVSEADVEALGDLCDAELQLLVIVSVEAGIADATANLLAPIVFEPASGRAVQLVLDDARLPLRAPLMAAAS